MEIIILGDGQGIPRYEIETAATGRIKCNFVGEGTPTVLTLANDKRKISKRVIDGVCEIDLDPFMNSDVRFVASAAGKIWNCGGVRVDRTESGGVAIRSLIDYAEKIKECFFALTHLTQTLENLEKVVDEIRKNGTNKTYNII